MNLIVVADITNAPDTNSLMLRFLTQNVKDKLKLDILLESPENKIDFYYHYLKNKGCFDYIDEILPSICLEDGIRLDRYLNYPKTILTSHIDFQNFNNLLGQIIFLSKI